MAYTEALYEETTKDKFEYLEVAICRGIFKIRKYIKLKHDCNTLEILKPSMAQ